MDNVYLCSFQRIVGRSVVAGQRADWGLTAPQTLTAKETHVHEGGIRMTEEQTMTASDMPVRVLLAGPDTLYFSCDLPHQRGDARPAERREDDSRAGRRERRVHCPDWLGARVLPNGARGGYAPHRDRRLHHQAVGQRHPQPPRDLRRIALLLPPYPQKDLRGPVRRRLAGCATNCSTTWTTRWCSSGLV